MIAVRRGWLAASWLLVLLALGDACGCPGGSATTGEVLELRASEAVLHGAASRMRVRGTAHLDDGIDHPVMLATKKAEATRWFHLVPVVDDDWEDGDPIPLWITCASTERDVESWKRALEAALARGPIDVQIVARAGLRPRERKKGWHDALEALAAADGPVTDPRAPIAEWPLP